MFEGSRLKVERAKKHIHDLGRLLEGFSDNPDFHSVSIDKMHEGLEFNVLVIHIHEPQEFLGQAALIIGDTLHNLRSALDILYCKIMTLNKSSPTKWTRFPIADEREEFKRQIGAALKKQQISEPVHSLAIDSIKPYKTGNFPLWSLHEMNIMDKHQLLIPTFQMMAVRGVRLENDKHLIVEYPPVFTEASCRLELDVSYGRNPTLQNKGRVTVGIGFMLGTPYEGQPVIPSLNGIAEEVTRTIQAFELLIG